jgi:mono/diheme cytochrome c family protein
VKKALKILGVIVGVLVLAIAGLASFIAIRGIPKYDVRKVEFDATPSPERLARGKHLVGNLCAQCHENPASGQLSGRAMPEMGTSFGRMYADNITRDPTHGIGDWSAGEIAWLLRTGIHPRTRRMVPPPMPRLIYMSDEDLASIIAFLKSDDPMVAAAAVPDQETKYTFLAKALSHVAFTPWTYPSGPRPGPDLADPVEHGRYLVEAVYECFPCHSADFETVNFVTPARSVGFLGGGNKVGDAMGNTIYTRNITPHDGSGIGKWSEADLARALRDGFRPDGALIRTPMMRYDLTDAEVAAVYAYLRSVPALDRPHKTGTAYAAKPRAGMSETETRGQALYYQYQCYACHAESGAGTCDFTDAAKKYPTDEIIVQWIKNPRQIVPHSRMPAWEGRMKDDEYAPLAAYVRWLGNNAK